MLIVTLSAQWMVIASAKYFSNAAVGMKWRNTQHCAVGRWILPSDLVIFKMIVRSVGGGGKFSSFICFLVLSQCTKKPWKALGIFLFLFSSFLSLLEMQALRTAAKCDCVVEVFSLLPWKSLPWVKGLASGWCWATAAFSTARPDDQVYKAQE